MTQPINSKMAFDEAWQYLVFLNQTPQRLAVIATTLHGKMTSSAMYWGKVYRLLDYFGIKPEMTVDEMRAIIKRLSAQKLVQILPDEPNEQVCLTQAGQKFKQKLLAQSIIYQPQYAGQYHYLKHYRWQQFLRLLLQTFSYQQHHQNKYAPATINYSTQQLVKAWYFNQPNVLAAQKLILATVEAWIKQNPTHAAIFVKTLTGVAYAGQTSAQLAKQNNCLKAALELQLVDAYFSLAKWLHQNQATAYLLQPFWKNQFISNSMAQTKIAFENHFTPTQIAQRRHLKQTTINEHLLILALVDDGFKANHLINHNLAEKLRRLVQTTHKPLVDWRFCDAKQQIPALDFMTLRLMQIAAVKRSQRPAAIARKETNDGR